MAETERSAVLRFADRPGDLGWIVQSHGEIYAEQYGWGADFEGLVAHIVGDYVQGSAARPRAAWIAEVDGERAGCIMLMPGSDERTAKLRVLLVSPLARGLGIGSRLIDELLRFAREAGYDRVSLWTTSNLTAARRLYERAGFELRSEAPARLFGGDYVEQTWVRELRVP
jgi:ribosomal protein S18 acetylase RimI-like enzyme